MERLQHDDFYRLSEMQKTIEKCEDGYAVQDQMIVGRQINDVYDDFILMAKLLGSLNLEAVREQVIYEQQQEVKEREQRKALKRAAHKQLHMSRR